MEQLFQIRDIDIRFADFICERDTDCNGKIRSTVELLSAAVGHGHICLDLLESFGPEGAEDISAVLRGSRVVGIPGEYCPLVLDDYNRLYLYRYWKYEHDLAAGIKKMLTRLPEVDCGILKEGIARLFGPKGFHSDTDWQRVAAAAAVRNRFCVISGGPGTGKTTAVVSILVLILEQMTGKNTKIALAAPTGKAAARLKESISGTRMRLAERTAVAGLLPEDVSTVHRLLGVIPGSSRFRHNKLNPLPYDVVVIDEASMVPLPLMAKVVDALPMDSRLILLGDRDQLASVEAGAILGDISDTGDTHSFSNGFADFVKEVTGENTESSVTSIESLLVDSIVVLQKNFRFGDDSVIGKVSGAINKGDGPGALRTVKTDGVDVCIEETPSQDKIQTRLEAIVVEGFRHYLEQKNPQDCLAAFDRFRVLCAIRKGRFGVEGFNKIIEDCLADHGLIRPGHSWYRGRPVMVTVNDYSMKLFNGDIGIALEDPDTEGNLSVFFAESDGGIRKISPFRIPDHETVYAMTIHKSQGSEFDRILIAMPPVDSQLLTRELLYTGITRARKSVHIWCREEQFISTVARRITRRSGLRQALWRTVT